MPAFKSGAEALDVLSRFVAAIEHTPMVAIQSFDRDGIVHFWNKASADLYGIQDHQALGRRLPDLLLYEFDAKEFLESIQTIWDSGEPVLPRDWQVKTTTGRNLWVYSTMFPVFQHNKVHQIFCMDVDITERKREEEALLSVGANFRSLFERSADAIMLVEGGRFVEVNPAALKLFGYTDKSDMIGCGPEDISPVMQADGKTTKERVREVSLLIQQNVNVRFEWLHVNRSNKEFWTEVLATQVSDEGNSLHYVVVRDISERKAAEQSLRLAAQVFESSREGILIADRSQRIITMNRALAEITGYQAGEVIGNTVQSLCAIMRDPKLFTGISAELESQDHWQGELWGRHRDGHGFPLWMMVNVVRDSAHGIVNYIAILTDISERKASEEQVRHMAEHDYLTGLPNRILLRDRLEQAIGAAQRNHTKIGILFLDLDRFKHINDSFGHHIGDKLLQTVADRLRKCIRGIDTVSRLGGDEFIVMLVDVGSSEPIAHITENILNSIAVPYSIEGCEFGITTCIGVSVFPHDGADVDTLLKNADTAMYHAKENGSDRYQFFDSEMNTRIVEKIMLENNLRDALKRGEFELYYQPQKDIAGNRIVGAEALIRWHHPALGLLLPDSFIPTAEQSGLIVPIGDWVLRTACLHARAWQENGIRIVVAVNLSVAQFQQKNLLQNILDALAAAQLEPQYLELEITESILMNGANAAIETLLALREIGVKLTIDDFGTGFSSLSYLKRIPINKLKIDQSFVRDITVDPEDAAIIDAIISMAKSLNLKVIAEGVETSAQLRFLKSHDCDEFQGHYFCKALRPQDFLSFVT